MQRFVNAFDMDGENPLSPRVGIVTFAGPPIGCRPGSTASICRQHYPYDEWVDVVSEPTAEVEDLLVAITDRPSAGRMTCISCGLEVAQSLLTSLEFSRPEAEPILLLLTDGRQTAGGTDAKAVRVANDIKNAGTTVITVSFGDADPEVMQSISSKPSSAYARVRPNAQPRFSALEHRHKDVLGQWASGCIVTQAWTP